MKSKLLNEIKRIKELSSIKEEKKVLNEGITDLLSDLKKLFEIASDEFKKTEIYKKLLKFFEDLKSGKISLPTQFPSSDPSVGTDITKSPSDVILPEKAKLLTSPDDDFYKSILSGIGAPWNDVNKLLMYSWRRAEGAQCRNNPFNTTLKMNEKTQVCGSHGEKHYESQEEGIQATLKTLESGKTKYKYQLIIDALKNSNPEEFFTALKSTPWGTTSDLVKEIYEDYVNGVSFREPTPIA